jgi:hypothetical protein
MELARPNWASYGVDERRLLDEIERYGPGAGERALDLFDRLVRWWAAVPTGEPAVRLAGRPGLG